MMTAESLIHLTIRAISMSHPGRRVALVLDPDMICDGEYLPIAVIEGVGVQRFPQDVADNAANWFGRDYRNAWARVNQINQVYGITEDQALAIAIEIAYPSLTPPGRSAAAPTVHQ